ncbi:uncharacterized protein ANIA_11399 [Aspergillus nidulans FGSC A4]|uniref:Uncharacterized protein n=1 Tax=Emericella nidulans (strain FGSC A4 / ATCC 38163 / CBS 112.46 / NRRL 194 / M139) TaxID=227321 RepID=C8V4S5_EMENI|nr:hypothetical protein [Aspergillus nidulans FGSC A4]CBF75946.1 TPA: hypothetical protein ANIA_11399 [Aspergillus nidulans FGSC A4]
MALSKEDLRYKKLERLQKFAEMDAIKERA